MIKCGQEMRLFGPYFFILLIFMFDPNTKRLQQIGNINKKVIYQLNDLFIGKVGVYIDYANVRPWSVKLGWNIDLKRLKHFLCSFNNVNSIKIYDGILKGDERSIKNAQKMGKIFKENFKTKPVKIMRQSIDHSSIRSDSDALLQKFIRRCLLKKYNEQTIDFLNTKFQKMNEKGIYYIEDLKCNFDVEIGVDLLLDHK